MTTRVERAARELRGQARVLAIVMWAVLAANWATPTLVDRFSGHVKGADFVQFYALASAVRAHDFEALTAPEQLRAAQDRAVPQAAKDIYPPVYPPQVALAVEPLAALPYPAALAFWSVLSAALYGASVWLIWKRCPHLRKYRSATAWLACGFPPFWWLVANGHPSALALLALTLALLALEREQRLLAGCAIGLLAYKWTLLLPAAAVCFFAGESTMLLGVAAVAVGQLALAVPVVGLEVIRQHFLMMTALARTPDAVAAKPYLMYSLRTFWAALAPGWIAVVLYVASALSVLVVAARAWRRMASAPGRIAIMSCAIVLAAPHFYAYDLVILAPAVLFAADLTLRLQPGSRLRTWLARSTYAVFLTLPIGLLAAVIRVQLATPLLLGWMLILIGTDARGVGTDVRGIGTDDEASKLAVEGSRLTTE